MEWNWKNLKEDDRKRLMELLDNRSNLGK